MAAARKRLWDSPHMMIRRVECHYCDGALVLRGRLPSYFLKQMAQEAVCSLDAIDEVVNEIEVSG